MFQLDDDFNLNTNDKQLVLTLYKSIETGLLLEAEELKEQIIDIRTLRQHGTSISLNDYSESALFLYNCFSLIQRSDDEFRQQVEAILIEETKNHLSIIKGRCE